MALRGRTIDVLRPVASGGDLDPAEALVPFQVELRNGRQTGASSWTRRPGRATAWDLGTSEPVVALISELGPYAVTPSAVYALRPGGNARKLLGGPVATMTRPTHIAFDDRIFVAGGERVRQITDRGVSDLGLAPVAPAAKPTVTRENYPGAIEPGAWRWMVVYLTADGRTAPGVESDPLVVGVQPPQTPGLTLQPGGGAMSSGKYRYRLSFVTHAGVTKPSEPTAAITVDDGDAVRLDYTAPSADLLPLVTGVLVWRDEDGSDDWRLMGNLTSVTTLSPTGGFTIDGLNLLARYDHLAAFAVGEVGGAARVALPSPDRAKPEGARVVGKELYRRRDGDVTQNTWKLVAQIDDSAAKEYVDELGSDKLGRLADGQDTTESRPPTGATHIVHLDDFVIVAGYDDFEFAWSTAGDPQKWPRENRARTQLDGGAFVGMVVLGRELLIFKRREIEVWVAAGGLLAFNRRQSLDKGALGGIVTANATVYWLGDDFDFYVLAGGVPRPLTTLQHGREVKKLTHPSEVYGLHFRAERIIRWFSPTDRRCIVYDYRAELFSEDSSWVGEHGFLPIASYMELPTAQGLVAYVGDSEHTSRIDEWSEKHATDRGKPIRCVRRFTVPLTRDGKKARVDRLEIRAKRGEGLSDRTPVVELRWSFDQSQQMRSTLLSLGDDGDVEPYVPVRNMGIGREMTLELVETDAVPYLVTHALLTPKPLGR